MPQGPLGAIRSMCVAFSQMTLRNPGGIWHLITSSRCLSHTSCARLQCKFQQNHMHTRPFLMLSASCSFPLKNFPKVGKENPGKLARFAVLKLLAPLWSFRLRGKPGKTQKIPLGMILTELSVCPVLSLASLRGCSLAKSGRSVPQGPD